MPYFMEVWDPYLTRNVKLLYPGSEIKDAVEADRQQRFSDYAKFWDYYEGNQYDDANNKKREELGKKPNEKLEEHQRKHSYSGVIADGIDFITDQLMEAMSVDVEKESESKEQPETQVLFEAIWENSEMDLVAPDLTREGLVSGDSYVKLSWDEVNETVKIIPYDAQMVNPVYSQDNYTEIERVYISYSKLELINGIEEQVDYTEEYVLVDNEGGYRECAVLKYRNDDENPYEINMLGVPFIPIIHIRTLRRRVRQSYGDSLVGKVCGDADRYNAICQLEFLIARYNSTGHLALFGDAANIKGNELFLGGEVADFWAFENTVEAKEIMLPTDNKMIESQKDTIEKQVYRKMGLQKMDLEDIKGLGAPSGYSLEIINRKSEGVFRRIRKELTKSFIEIFDKSIDMTAYKTKGGEEWWKIDPLKIYVDRKVTFNFGSVFVVDAQQVRDDYTAGLISLKRALMLKGYSETEALEMIDEIVAEKGKLMENEMEGISSIVDQKLGGFKKEETEEE